MEKDLQRTFRPPIFALEIRSVQMVPEMTSLVPVLGKEIRRRIDCDSNVGEYVDEKRRI